MKINKNQVLKTLFELVNSPKSICVALSGGADSVCLLHILSYVCAEKGIELSAVHINHHLRGDEADRDAEFCKRLCESLSVPLQVKDVYVEKQAKKGESTELAARRLRYEVFSQIKVDYIATAHNADDSLETFLINFSRGTGLRGLSGIPPVRDNFVRPLYKYSKAEIISYCEDNGLDYVTDSSNLTNDYTRNKIRHNVIPELKDIFPEIISVATRNMELIKCDSGFIDSSAKELYNASVSENGIAAEPLLNSHRSLSTRVLMDYCTLVTGRVPDNLHLNEMFELLKRKSGKTELWSGYFARIKNGYFSIKKTRDFEFSVKYEVISAENFKNQLKINNLLLKNAIDYDKMSGKLILRNRLPEDRLSPAGRGLSKPVRKLQAEAKIDSDLRDKAPIAADDIGVIWGYMIGVDERVRVDKNTRNIMILKVYKSENRGQ